MEELREECKYCRCWAVVVIKGRDSEYGFCRFSPPVPIYNHQKRGVEIHFPMTKGSMWCGQFQSIPLEDAEELI